MLTTVFTDRHHLHPTDRATIHGQPFHEVPARADLIAGALRQTGWSTLTEPVDHGLDPIRALHPDDYLDFLRTIFDRAQAMPVPPTADQPLLGDTFATRSSRRRSPHPWAALGQYTFDIEVPFFPGTWEAAYWSAQTALTAADRVLAGERAAYGLCRPPGHHALADQAGGFCYLNNAAIAARYLQHRHVGMRVAILDIDYHHGNGIQEIFYADPSVFYVSLHGDPDHEYPFFWGGAEERGAGTAVGANLNLPLPMGTSDAQYLEALDDALDAVREFAPLFVVVVAGFDIAAGDPAGLGGGFAITRDGFAAIGRRIRALDAPLLLLQEGGYGLDVLPGNAVTFLEAFRSE
jgi:acetoin utilization deacetylase AcuC-like enzyme